MKKFKHINLITLLLAVAVISLTYCTKHDKIINPNTMVTPTPVLDTDTLYAVKGTATLQPIGGSAWDGTIESVWNGAPKLTVHAVVPDLGNNTFTGYVGNATDITLRSLYDANNIYFLVSFTTPQANAESAQWYFNPTTHQWAQEVTAATLTNLNPDGSYRPPFAQDQLVMMFNISDQEFTSTSCYAACHVMSSYGGTTTPAGGAMYTNGPTERLDCWRGRMFQVMPMNQLNDCFIDDGSSVGLGESGTLDKNMVHSDWQVNNGHASSVPPAYQTAQAADGGFSNKQSLTITGKTTKENVPIWIKPGGNYINKAILLSDTGSTALMVTAVDSNGVLTLKDGTTIDPSTAASGSAYQQVGTGDGAKCVPGNVVGAYTGSRGDVTCNAFNDGTQWNVLIKRALTTSDNANDVDFSSLHDQPFGVGAMFNGADNEHAIVAGLMLHFKK